MALTLLAPTYTVWNGFTLPNVKERPRITRTAKLRSATPSGFLGDYSQGGLPSAKHITASGKLVLRGGQTLDAALGELHAALPIALTPDTDSEWSGEPSRKLYIRKDAGRFYRAEVESVAESDSAEYSFCDYDVVFYVPDGLEYDNTPQTVNFASGAAAATSAGSYRAAPAYTINVTTAAGTVTLSNTTTGQSLVITPTATGAITVNTRTQAITRAGADIPVEALGQMPELLPGVNALTLTAAGGAALGSSSLTWRDRWE